MAKIPSFTEYPKGSKNRENTVNEDKLIEEFLRKLGFKPGQIFSLQELTDKMMLFYKVATKDEIEKFTKGLGCKDEDDWYVSIMELIDSDLLQKYYHFIPENEIKELKELRGEK